MMNWEDYTNKPVVCECGKMHRCDIGHIFIESGAINQLPELIQNGGYQKIWLVLDVNTNKAAGEQVSEVLKSAGISWQSYIYKETELIPDEAAVGRLLIHMDADCDLIIAVGSGTINDLCRFVSYKMQRDYFIVATAPSVDGYASNVAPLIVDHLKTTYECRPPQAIIGDIDILKEAPMPMIAAGVGDMLGKYVCLADWQLSALVTGEYICDYALSLVRTSLESVIQGVTGVAKRDPESIGAIMAGLVLSGVVMSYIGNSRPASGSEHHLSHYWEMISLQHGSHGALHGTKVGIGTVTSLTLYQEIKEKLPEQINGVIPFSYGEWAADIRMAYGPAAPGVLALEQQVGKNSDVAVSVRLDNVCRHKAEIIALIEALPSADEIENILKVLNVPGRPEQIGVVPEVLTQSIAYAKDLRNRYGLLQLIYDLEQVDK